MLIVLGGGNYFIFFDSNPHLYNEGFLVWLKKTIPNIKMILVFVNSMKQRKMRDIYYFKKYMDIIYTLDYEDAKNYDFIYWEGIHSALGLDRYEKNEYDVVYCGVDKGRGTIICTIFKILKEKGMNCKFTVVGLENPVEGIHTQRVSYKEVLDDELRSRCILEICSEEQKLNTLRMMEAIMYNKLLVTNNQLVKNNRYYDEKHMLIFKNLKDIMTWELPDDVECFSYDYRGEFSPRNLLRDIKFRTNNLAE